MNNIFQKNISALSLKNPALVQRLLGYVPTEIPQLVKENSFYNIVYRGKYVHNQVNPLAEAREIFSMANNSPVSIHLVYGLGLGYLFQVASAESKGSVILYEPDLNILRLVLELVDFSTDIMKPNVFVADNFEDVSQIIYKKSGMKNSPEMLSLPSQREFDSVGFDNLVKQLQDLIGAFTLDRKYTTEKFYPSLKMLLKNIPNLMNEVPLIKYKDSYKGKTALIVSAGPSLDRDIEIIKKYRNNVVVFAVGTALKTLIAHKIKPDFLCIIETYNSSRQVENIDLSDVYFVTEPYSNPTLRTFKFKQIFSHISANTPINHFWAEICNENIEEYWSKGTVSYTALNCARILGCSKIVLTGQDLAYIEGQCYSKDSAYKDLVCKFNHDKQKWEIVAKDFEKFALAISPSANPEFRIKVANKRLERLNSSLYYVKGIKGDMIPTESVYAAFVKPLSEFSQHFNDREYINTSLVGAQIDGFENLPLENVLKDTEPVGDLSLSTNFEYNKESIFANLSDKLGELRQSLLLIEEGKRFAKSLNNDLKRYKNAGTEVLKSLKKLSVNYLNLSSDFANKSKLYDYITTADKIDLDYEMKMIRDFDYESVSRISEKLTNYYINAEKRVLEIEGLINESINTKG